MARKAMGLMDSAGILTTDDVCLAVREAGFALGPEDISLDLRDERLAVAMSGGYMAWFRRMRTAVHD
jgi:hypothetical protein